MIAILYYLFAGICGILFFFLVFPFFKVLVSLFSSEKIEGKKDLPETDFACIITAYKNAEITKPGVQSLLKQNYSNFEIYVMADECDISDYNLTDEKLSVFSPDPPLRLKAKSIIYAIEHFKRAHKYILIFDADNLAHPDFLKIINQYVHEGYTSIQGQRTAKNLDTMYACADATGEFYKNYIERYVPYLIGSSSVISGSGMAVEAELYKAYLASPEIQQGQHKWKKMLQEDKILQNFLLRRKEKISYAWDAVVYDEKVTSAEQVETQRSRWLYSYFQNLPNSSGLVLRGLLGLNYNQLIFGLITIAPPLFILLFSSFGMMLVAAFVDMKLAVMMFTGLAIFVLNIFFVLYLSKVPTEIWKALWGIPPFIWNQVTALFKMVDPDKNFKHTEHKVSVSIDEMLQEEQKES